MAGPASSCTWADAGHSRLGERTMPKAVAPASFEMKESLRASEGNGGGNGSPRPVDVDPLLLVPRSFGLSALYKDSHATSASDRAGLNALPPGADLETSTHSPKSPFAEPDYPPPAESAAEVVSACAPPFGHYHRPALGKRQCACHGAMVLA